MVWPIKTFTESKTTWKGELCWVPPAPFLPGRIGRGKPHQNLNLCPSTVCLEASTWKTWKLNTSDSGLLNDHKHETQLCYFFCYFFTETLFRVEEHFPGCRPAANTILRGVSLPLLGTLRVHGAYYMWSAKELLPWVLYKISWLDSFIGNFCLFSCLKCWHITN